MIISFTAVTLLLSVAGSTDGVDGSTLFPSANPAFVIFPAALVLITAFTVYSTTAPGDSVSISFKSPVVFGVTPTPVPAVTAPAIVQLVNESMLFPSKSVVF